MRLALAFVVFCAVDAEARGIYFHIYGDREIVAETTVITRCPSEIEDRLRRSGKLATCRPVRDGWIAGVAKGTGIELSLVRKTGGVAWRRTLEGTVAFADEAMLVFATGSGYRVIWLSQADGSTRATATFAPIAAQKLPTWCGDRIEGVYRSTEKTPRLAAVCRVLD